MKRWLLYFCRFALLCVYLAFWIFTCLSCHIFPSYVNRTGCRICTILLPFQFIISIWHCHFGFFLLLSLSVVVGCAFNECSESNQKMFLPSYIITNPNVYRDVGLVTYRSWFIPEAAFLLDSMGDISTRTRSYKLTTTENTLPIIPERERTEKIEKKKNSTQFQWAFNFTSLKLAHTLHGIKYWVYIDCSLQSNS